MREDEDYTDEILEELSRVREEFGRRFNYDIHAMFEYLREREKEHPERVIHQLPPREPQPGEPRAA